MRTRTMPGDAAEGEAGSIYLTVALWDWRPDHNGADTVELLRLSPAGRPDRFRAGPLSLLGLGHVAPGGER